MKKWLCLALTLCLLLSGAALAEPAETTVTAQQAVALDISASDWSGQSKKIDNVLTFGLVDNDSAFLTLDGSALNNLPNATLYWHKDRGLFLRDNNAGTWIELTLGNQKLTMANLQKLMQSVEELPSLMTSASMTKDMELIGQALAKVAEDFCNSPEVRMALARLGVGAASAGNFSIDSATVNAVLGRLSAAVQEAVKAILAPELVEKLGKETQDAIIAISTQLQLGVRNFVRQVEDLELPSFSVELITGRESMRLRALCDAFQLDISASPAGENVALDGTLSPADAPDINISGTIGENTELLLSSESERDPYSWEAKLLASFREGTSNDAWSWYRLLQASVDYTQKRGDMLDESHRVNLSYLTQHTLDSTSIVLTIDSMGEDESESIYAELQNSSDKWSGSLKTYTNAWAYKELSGSLEMLDEGIRFTYAEDNNKLTAELSAAEGVQVPVPGTVTQVLDLQQLLTLLN